MPLRSVVRNLISYTIEMSSVTFTTRLRIPEMNERLKDNGFLIFETGNLGDVEEKYFKLFTSFQLPDHLCFFSDKNLKELLQRTGFEFINT